MLRFTRHSVSSNIRSIVRTSLFSLLVFGNGAFAAQTSGVRPIRFAMQPTFAPDGKRIAFEYQGDIWTVSSEGGRAERFTVHEAHDYMPAWSPDGKWIAFSSNRTGNYDVWIMPAEGGKPKQLTFHSAADLVSGWTPDSKAVLFSSARETTRSSAVYSVNIDTGASRLLAQSDFPLANGVVTPDGSSIVCTKSGSWTRRGYKGSANATLVQFALSGGAGKYIVRGTDNARWAQYSPDGKTLYFVSDRDGAANLWKRQASNIAGAASEITHFTTGNLFYPSISRDGSRIVFMHDFALWATATSGRAKPKELVITAPSDDRTNPVKSQTFTSGVKEATISRDGKLLAFIVHGDIFVQPLGGAGGSAGAGSAGGEAPDNEPSEQAARRTRSGAGSAPTAPVITSLKRLTDTPQREQDIAWSPDGTQLAFVSDRDGNANIYTLDIKTKATKQLTRSSATDKIPVFSPDGKTISFLRGFNGEQLITIPSGGGAEKVLAQDPDISNTVWSPDSRWIAFDRTKSHSAGTMADLFVVNVATGKSTNITRYPMVNTNPIWAPDGTALFFLSDRSTNRNLWRVNLLSEPPAAPAASEPKTDASTKSPAEVKIDFEDIEKRAKQLTHMEGDVTAFAVAPDGASVIFSARSGEKPDVWRVSANGGSPTRITQNGEVANWMEFTPDGQQAVYLSAGTVHSLAVATGVASTVPISVKMEIDLHADLVEMFDEAWRKMRDVFYDTKMHGADWSKIRETYRPIVDDITYKEDFYTLFALVLGELNASHVGLTPPASPDPDATASIGAALDDRYEGPGVKIGTIMPKGPADKDRSRLKPGEYIIKVDDTTVTTNEQFYHALAGKTGKSVSLLVNSTAKEDGARTVKIRAITTAAYKQLEYDRWVAEREKQTASLSNGKLGYIHLSAMDAPNLEKFKRLVFGDLNDKDGLVLDVRFNGGGRIADDVLAILQNRVSGYRTIRGDPKRTTSPLLAFAKPTVVLINEASFSNAEVFPWGFKALKLGKVVGVPTYGAVIGTGATDLIDGSTLRCPEIGAYTYDGADMELNGCPPDIYVENTLADELVHHDAQLERAAAELVKQIGSKP